MKYGSDQRNKTINDKENNDEKADSKTVGAAAESTQRASGYHHVRTGNFDFLHDPHPRTECVAVVP